MLSDGQLRYLEDQVNSIYQNGEDQTQKSMLDSYMTDITKIPILQNIVENLDSSNNIDHFALVSLRSLFEITFNDWDSDTFCSLCDWCLQNLLIKAEKKNSLCIDAFCKLYGLLFSCGFRLFDDFQLDLNDISNFLNSDKILYISIGLKLCSNILYSTQKIESELKDEQIAFFKESTVLTCFSLGCNILKNQDYLSETILITDSIELLVSSLTFDVDITKELTMINLPRTESWNNAISDIIFLLSTASDLYFNYINLREVRKSTLDLIFYLTSITLEYSHHIEYLNCVIDNIIKIIQANPLFTDIENISRIHIIILKINSTIISDDFTKIPLFKQFISDVFNHTMQFFDLDTFISNINEFSTLLSFWSNISSSYPEKVKKLTTISQNLYDTLINAANSNFDLFFEFGIQFTSFLSSFVYKIGIHTDRDFFKAILSNFEQFQNELYELYDTYIKEDGLTDYSTSLNSLELKIAYSAFIMSAPLIRPINVRDDYLMSFSMSELIKFFISSGEKITSNTKIANSYGNELYQCSTIENAVIYLISQIEKGSKANLERSFTSITIMELESSSIDISMIPKLHTFFLNRLLKIVKFYPSDDPIIENVFDAILSFNSLKLSDVTSVYMCDTFLDEFLYRKMRLKPNKKVNIFQGKDWKNSVRIKFHRIFGILLSTFSDHMKADATKKSDYEQRRSNFMFYLRDLNDRIKNMQANDNYLAELYLNDLIGLFKEAKSSEAYSILVDLFFNSIPIFHKYQVNFHYILQFFSVYTQNRELLDQNIKEKKDTTQPKLLADLLVFKEAGSYLIDFFDLFDKSPESLSVEIKYVYSILSNIFEYYSSCIGAMKLYGDDIYKNLFNSTISNLSYVLANMNSLINFDTPTKSNIKFVYLVLNFITVLGNKRDLLLDVFKCSNQIFTIIFGFFFLIMTNKAFYNTNILSKMFEITDLVSSFFLINKDNEIGQSLLSIQETNISLLQITIDNILNMLLASPQMMSIHASNSILNFIFLCSNEDFLRKINDTISYLMDVIMQKDLLASLNKIYDLLNAK